MERFRAAVVQYAVKPLDVEENLRRGRVMVGRCVEQCGARLLVLPESCTTGFSIPEGPQELWHRVDPIPGRLTDAAEAWAREFGCYLCFPTYERGPAPDVVYNSAALVGPEGLLGVYRKTHPFPTERREAGGWTTPGSDPVCVETPLGRIGMVICYDGDFPELARVTTLMGAEVICRPSAFLRSFDHWELTNRARAYDNHVYWVATNAVGPDAGGGWFAGGSMIVHPTGVKLAQARSSDEFAWADLDPDPLRTVAPGSSAPQIFDHVEDRNLRAYQYLLQEGTGPFEPASRTPYRR